VARVGAVLRRYLRMTATNTVREFGGWTLDLVRRELADPQGTIIALTRGEFDLLAALVQADRLPLSRDYLLEVLTSVDSNAKERTIDVLVSRVRRELATSASVPPRIVARYRAGYVFEPPAESAASIAGTRLSP
jgi:two-component system torCAD operon response regulator TorR